MRVCRSLHCNCADAHMGVSGATSASRIRALALLLLLFSLCTSASASLLSAGICPKYDVEEYLLLRETFCSRDGDGNPVDAGISPRVAEFNGTTLEKALSVLQSKEDEHAAVLFYASWCPFSREFRLLLDILSSHFPTIYHIAVEDSAIQPSSLSQYGVHSFPVLFLQNKTVKVRYYGPRTVKAISQFYEDTTDTTAFSQNKRGTNGFALIENLSRKGTFQNKANCPYPWAKSPEKWLRNDMYLLLATSFLVLRVLVYFMPRLFSSAKHYWVQTESSLGVHKVLLRKVLLREQGPVIRSSPKSSFEGERVRKGKNVLSVPGWSSVSVSLAEGSSSRTGSIEDSRETGHAFPSHFWN